MTYLGYDDYFDFYSRKRLQLGAKIGTKNGILAMEMSANLEEHGSLSKLDDFKGWLFRNVQRENPAVPEGRMISLQGRLDFNLKNVSIGLVAEHAPAA